jgi:hypothetical protein
MWKNLKAAVGTVAFIGIAVFSYVVLPVLIAGAITICIGLFIVGLVFTGTREDIQNNVTKK